MKCTVSLTPQAQADLVGIWRYTKLQWDEDQADHYLNHLHSGIELLRKNPTIGFDYSHVSSGYRKLRIKQHQIFYTLDETNIKIVRVLHVAMDAENRLT